VTALLNSQLNLFNGSTELGGLCFLIFEISRGHSDTTHSVGLLWMGDRPEASLLPDNPQHSQATDIHALTQFKLPIAASKRPQTDALDHKVIGIGFHYIYFSKKYFNKPNFRTRTCFRNWFQESRPFGEGFHFIPLSNWYPNLCLWNLICHIAPLFLLNY